MTTSVQQLTPSPEFVNDAPHDHEKWKDKDNQNVNHASVDWVKAFRTLFEQKVMAYKSGIHEVEAMFSKDDEDFLRSIGATSQEIFDFVEDWCDAGVPDPETVLAITKIRRDYFIHEQQGQLAEHPMSESQFPPRDTSLAGLTWFPRIIEKARAKLRGELPPDLMYSCAGDRRFLNSVNINPVEFLQTVREAGEKTEHIVKYVTDRAKP